jgi:hypothetical protein
MDKMEPTGGHDAIICSAGNNATDHSPKLAHLADRIRQRQRNATKDVIGIGKDLTTAKKMVGHGQFQDWIEREFAMTVRTAQSYMRIAECADKYETISLLPPTQAGLLASPSAPEEIIVGVLAEANAGTVIGTRQLKARIREAREPAKAPQRQRSRRSRAQIEAQREVHEARQRDQEQTVREAKAILAQLPDPKLQRLQEIAADAGVWFAVGRALKRDRPESPSR